MDRNTEIKERMIGRVRDREARKPFYEFRSFFYLADTSPVAEPPR